MPSKIDKYQALKAEYAAFKAWAETVSSLSIVSTQAIGTSVVDGVSTPRTLTGNQLGWLMAAIREKGADLLKDAVKLAKAEAKAALSAAKQEAETVLAEPDTNGGN